MEAVIQTGGHQYPVSKGQKLKVSKLAAKVGDVVTLDVLAVLGDKPQFGAPLVDGAKVEAKVLSHGKHDKIIVSTYKRRKGFHKQKGHRQDYTEIQIL